MSTDPSSQSSPVVDEKGNKVLICASTEQIANTARRYMKRRYVDAYRKAQIGRARAKTATKRLERLLRDGEIEADESTVGVLQIMRRKASNRVVGPSWRSPRPGRRW